MKTIWWMVKNVLLWPSRNMALVVMYMSYGRMSMEKGKQLSLIKFWHSMGGTMKELEIIGIIK